MMVLFLGQVVESESNDRRDIDLPGHQMDLLQDAVKYSEYISDSASPIFVIVPY